MEFVKGRAPKVASIPSNMMLGPNRFFLQAVCSMGLSVRSYSVHTYIRTTSSGRGRSSSESNLVAKQGHPEVGGGGLPHKEGRRLPVRR